MSRRKNYNLTISLPLKLIDRLYDEARARNTSVSAIIRECLSKYLDRTLEEMKSEEV